MKYGKIDAQTTLDVSGTLDADRLDTIEANIMLNAFRVAVNGSLTQFNMVDGIVDEYEDESAIDTATSTNENYNSTDDYYAPSGDVLSVAPFAHYKLNETSGTTVNDSSGSNNGTATVNITNLTYT